MDRHEANADIAGGMMARARMPGIFILSPLLFGSSLAAQQQFPTIVYEVKETVVKVEIHLVNTQDREIVSDQLKLCFEASDYCVIGTGVRINDNGDVLTAAHVARDTTVASQILRDLGIESEVMVAGEARNDAAMFLAEPGRFKGLTKVLPPRGGVGGQTRAL